jgi:hypothetical protein
MRYGLNEITLHLFNEVLIKFLFLSLIISTKSFETSSISDLKPVCIYTSSLTLHNVAVSVSKLNVKVKSY